MRPLSVGLASTVMLACLACATQGEHTITEASPLFAVTIPNGYRQWELIAPALEAAPLDELRVVLGNSLTMKAYRQTTPPFPDGTILVKLAWEHHKAC